MEPMIVFPERETTGTDKPNHTINSEAYYAAASYSENPIEDFRNIKYSLEVSGESDILNQAKARWASEQDQSAKNTVFGLMNDATVSPDIKKAALSSYVMGGFVSNDLREKYKLSIAARDVAKTNEERNMQDLWIDSMQQRDLAGKELQQEMDKFGADLNPSKTNALFGIVRDVLPGVALTWNASVAKSAREIGTDKTLMDSFKSFMFSGSGNRAIRDEYNLLPIEQKKDFVKRLVETYKDNPGFDFNKWIDFQTQLETEPVPKWMVGLENVASVFNVIGLGWLLRAGKGAFKYEGLVRPRVNPVSPAGTTSTVNPQVAQKFGSGAVADSSGELAKAAGTSRAELVSDWVLPKLDATVEQTYPDLARDLAQLDNYMQGVYKENKFDPSIASVTEREIDLDKVSEVVRTTKGPVYQQANSSLEEALGKVEGIATFGKNESFGWKTQEAAQRAADKVQESILRQTGDTPGLVSVEKAADGMFYVKWKYGKEYNELDALVFGSDSISAKFTIPLWGGKEIGIKADGLARSIFGKHVFPSTMRLPEWVPKGAALADMRAAKVEHDFIRELKSNVWASKHKQELYDLIRESEEVGSWKTPAEVSSMFPHLSTDGVADVYRAYSYMRRLSEYEYQWANRYDRFEKTTKNYKTIYGKDGQLLGYGTPNVPANLKPKVVWDYVEGKGINLPEDLAGKTLVRLETTVEDSTGIYEYGLVDKLHDLPQHTLPRIEVYFPRKNLENWYIRKIPKEASINGEKISSKTKEGKKALLSHQKTIGAADTKAEAELMAAKFSEEFPEHEIAIRQERADTPDAILTDYKVYRELFNYSRKRGERLPTPDGVARIEDPLVSLIQGIKTTVRMGAWKDYTEAFRENWLKAFSEFTDKGEFPSVLTDLRPPKGGTPEEIKKFKSAQRLFEQYTNQAYKSTLGDYVWKEFFFNISDVLEKLPMKLPHQLAKEVGKKGNLLVKAPKALGTFLFIDSNVPRQWLVQPQQLLELTFLDKEVAKAVSLQTGPVVGAIIAKAKGLSDYTEVLHNSLQKISGLSKQEFDDVVEAVYRSGVPQSVDLNMMLHGAFSDVERALVESSGRKFWEGTKAVATMPKHVGRSIGYTPAELTNQVGVWLATRARWMKNNPGQKWNTPEAIAQITGDSWDIAHSMTTRAGAFPYQEGAMSLLMQFVAVQHKAFMQTFSSKTLTNSERAKLGAARIALYGMMGVPAGAAIDTFLEKYADENTKTEWQDWKRGLVDWTVNNMINAVLDDPENKSDVAVAAALSPLPHYAPYVDLITELSKFGSDSKGNPRLPFTSATGSVFSAAHDVWNLYRTQPLESEQTLERAGRLAMETMSGYNNFAKYMMIKNFGDKKDKLGNLYGLNLTDAEMRFQLLGVTSQKEVELWAAQDFKRQREEYVKQHAQDIHRQLMGMRDQFGKEEFNQYVTRLNALAALSDQDVVDDVKAEVLRLDKQSLLTRNESLITYIIQHYKDKNDRYISSMIAHLTSSENPQAQRNIEALKKEGIIK